MSSEQRSKSTSYSSISISPMYIRCPLLPPLSKQSWDLVMGNKYYLDGSSFVLPSPQHEEQGHGTRTGPQDELSWLHRSSDAPPIPEFPTYYVLQKVLVPCPGQCLFFSIKIFLIFFLTLYSTYHSLVGDRNQGTKATAPLLADFVPFLNEDPQVVRLPTKSDTPLHDPKKR